MWHISIFTFCRSPENISMSPCKGLPGSWYSIQKFPRFDWYFSNSYRIFPTANEFYRQLTNFTTGTEFYRQEPFFSRRKTPDCARHIPTFLHPNRCVLFRYIPSSFPTSTPLSRPPTPLSRLPPSGPAGPVEIRFPPLAACTKQTNFTDTITEFCQQLLMLPT